MVMAVITFIIHVVAIFTVYPKVSKVGIYCGYYLYHDLVTVQEKVIHKIMD